jgi:AICAR transformylase/IMP cyclohydrolase PurH
MPATRCKMRAMRLKYGMNQHQRFASAEPVGGRPPVEVLNGTPSLINLLDAINAWQLVRELHTALGSIAATSFKHVSPAGAAIAKPLDPMMARIYEVEATELTPASTAYVRARGADPKSSFGDFVAISAPIDVATARFLKSVVSDGIIAPGYEPEALALLRSKKAGNFIVMRADPSFEPPERESRELFGMRLIQDRNTHVINRADLDRVACGAIDDGAALDLVLGLITLKYTQSNSVGYAIGGQMIGIGAGQQSRVDCTKLAGAKADMWHLQRHPKVLSLQFRPGVKRQERINLRVRYIEGDLSAAEQSVLDLALEHPAPALTAIERAEFLGGIRGVSLVSDGYLPFRDNIDEARRHGVSYIAQPGGSMKDEEIIAACRQHGVNMALTGLRLFHH